MAAMIGKQGISRSRRRPRASVGSKTAEPGTPTEATASLVSPPGRCNVTAMCRAMRRVSQIYDEVLAPCGLRSTQKSMLDSIAKVGRPTMGEVAASLVLDRSALAHNIKPPEREELVEVVADDNDKRNRLVALTEAGWAKLARSMPLWEEVNAVLSAHSARRRECFE